MTELVDDRRGAVFSDCRTYRYRLWRKWDDEKPTVVFIMLNPSTADATSDDPTIRRCLGYAKTWDYGRLEVVNLFGLRAKEPRELYGHPDPVGPENDEHLRAVIEDDPLVVAAWGHHGSLLDRGPDVAEQLDVELFALDTTEEGHPAHPLFQPADADPVPFSYGGNG